MVDTSNIDVIHKTAAVLAASLGPCGLDKLLVDDKGNILVTNDGATILSHLPITHPAMKLLLDVAKTQERHVGDGTTTAVLLTASLLQQATTLLQSGVHSTIIVQEYKRALELAKQTMQTISVRISGTSSNTALRQIAKTAISSKVLARYSDFFAELAVTAVQSLANPSFHKVNIITRTGDSMTKSRLLPSGCQLRPRNRPSLLHGIPKQFSNGSILVTSVDLNTGHPARIIGTSAPSLLGGELLNWAITSTELDQLKLSEISETVCLLGVAVVVALSPIAPFLERSLVERGVLPIAVSTVEELERVAACAACTVAPFLAKDIKLGNFKSVVIIAPQDAYDSPDSINIEGTGTEMCTVELVAPTDGLVAECERSFHDMLLALLVTVDEPMMVGGGGSVPIELCVRLRAQTSSLTNYSTICLNAFCEALMIIPQTLAINGGYDAVQLMQACYHYHKKGHTWHGVELENGQLVDMLALGIVEPLAVFREGLVHAVALVELVLKTDKNIVTHKRQEIV